MGLEALSRGACHAVFCDLSQDAAEIVKTNAKKTRLDLQSDIFHGDYKEILQRLIRKRCFDVVFLDPPYALSLVPQALERLIENNLLSQNAKVICETASFEDVFGGNQKLADSFEVIKQTKYGIAHITILQFGHIEKGTEL